MEQPKKKWVSSRLKSKKDELGLNNSTEEEPVKDKIVKRVSKPKKNFSQEQKSGSKRNSKKSSKINSKKGSKRNSKKGSRNYNRNRPKHVIRISNLPPDITVRELSSLVSEWGDIGNINIKEYSESYNSYIDFFNKEEADYFVKALNNTPFDHYIINVELMDFS